MALAGLLVSVVLVAGVTSGRSAVPVNAMTVAVASVETVDAAGVVATRAALLAVQVSLSSGFRPRSGWPAWPTLGSGSINTRVYQSQTRSLPQLST